MGHPVAVLMMLINERRRRLLGRRESEDVDRAMKGRQLPERPLGTGRRSGVGPLRRHAGPAQGQVWRGGIAAVLPRQLPEQRSLFHDGESDASEPAEHGEDVGDRTRPSPLTSAVQSVTAELGQQDRTSETVINGPR